MLRSVLDLQNTIGQQVWSLEKEKFSKSKKPELALQLQTQQLRTWNQVGACSVVQKSNNRSEYTFAVYWSFVECWVPQMGSNYFNADTMPSVLVPTVGKLYAAKVDGEWHRVEVTNVSYKFTKYIFQNYYIFPYMNGSLWYTSYILVSINRFEE